MTSKFAHEESYRSEKELATLAKKHIVVCGAGALGSLLIDTLARQGCENLTAIDMDRVEEHNLNTQIYGIGDVGQLKVAALQSRLYRDVYVELNVHNKEMTQSNIKKFCKKADIIVDVFDNSKSRKLVYDYANDNNISCIHAGMFEGYGEVMWNDNYTVPQDAQEEDQDVCDYPLARNLVLFTSTICAEEIVNFLTQKEPRKKNWAITLKDLKISSFG